MKLPSPNTKIGRVLDALLMGNSINLFEAQQQLHDRCLHSTISSLKNDYGIKISKKMEFVPGYLGYPTWCMRYWIDSEERERIRACLSGSLMNDESV